MAIKRIEGGSRMSEAVIHNGTVYLSGSTADNLDQDIKGQTRETLGYIEHMLRKCGTSKSNLLSAVVWIKTFQDFPGMNAEWDKWVDPKNTPVRATVHSAELFDPRVLVEIKVIAALPDRPAKAARKPVAKRQTAKRQTTKRKAAKRR